MNVLHTKYKMTASLQYFSNYENSLKYTCPSDSILARNVETQLFEKHGVIC